MTEEKVSQGWRGKIDREWGDGRRLGLSRK